RSGADVNPLKAPVVLLQHERVAPVRRDQTFHEIQAIRLESTIGIQIAVEPGVADVVHQLVKNGNVFDSAYNLVERPGGVLDGAGEIEVLPIRVEDADILYDPHQSHWDHDRF